MIPNKLFVISSITLSLFAATEAFHAGSPTDYAHQSSEKVTIGAKPYDSPELQAQAFGKKLDLLKYGVEPVLVVIENKRAKTVDLSDMKVTLVSSDGRHADAVQPDQLFALGAPRGGGGRKVPLPVPIPMPKKKNPMNSPELEIRSFTAKLLAPGDSASGFFYFEAKSEPGDKLYVDGLSEMPSGQQLLYFEFPLGKEAE